MQTATPLPWPRESAEPKLAVFQNAPVAVAQCSLEGTITAMNPAMEQMFGKFPPPVSQSFLDLIHSQDREQGEHFLQEIFSAKRESFQLETELATDSLVAPVKWTVWRVDDKNGKPDWALVVAEKMVADKAASAIPLAKIDTSNTEERHLRHAEKLETVGRIASSVAHDFNSLLTGVLLYCDLLREGIEPEDRLRRYVDEIHAAGTQAAGLVQQLLDLARPRAATQRLLSLNEIVDGTRGLLTRLIGDHISLLFQLDPDLGLVKMDPTQVRQILLNLVLNARDAMPRGGMITVETSNCQLQILTHNRPGNPHAAVLPCVLFAVTDNGFGMSAETKKHVFEAFFTTKSPETSTGLGLATVHDIVKNNGGLVNVESEPGHGTRVTVLLPLAPKVRLNDLCSTDLQHAVNEGELPYANEEPTP